MICLGIESTAHTFGIGIYNYENKKVLSNVYKTYSKKFGGMKPSDAADHHAQEFDSILKEALNKANVKFNEIEIVSFSQGPGLAPCLRFGRSLAVYISSRLNVPLIPVHHSVAHIEIGKFSSYLEDPVVIYVSGGNTQLLIKKDDSYVVLGETLDIGLGNAIDNVARDLELEVAHGGTIEKLALEGKYVELPYVVKGMDFSFTGIITKISQIKKENKKEDLAYSLQETSFSMLCEAAERALMITKKREVLLCGGVAQNKRLQEMVSLMCEENNVKFGVAPDEFNRDNGAMISYLGYLSYKNNKKEKENEIRPRYRIEEFKI